MKSGMWHRVTRVLEALRIVAAVVIMIAIAILVLVMGYLAYRGGLMWP